MLVAVGVLDGFAVVETDAASAPDSVWTTSTAGFRDRCGQRDRHRGPPSATSTWCATTPGPPPWPCSPARPETRAAVLAAGSYTAWWLARHARLHGHRPGFWRLPSATGLGALYDPLPGSGADDAVLAAAGVRADLTVADAGDAADLLARLADPRRRPDVALTAAAHAALGRRGRRRAASTRRTSTADRVRALDGTGRRRRPHSSSSTHPAGRGAPAGEVVVGGDPRALADLLDLPTASEVVDGEVAAAGRPAPWARCPKSS